MARRLIPRYNVICADPPWSFGDKLGKRGAESNYKVMSLADIEQFRPDLIHRDSSPDALLFLWRVSSQIEEALRVARAWAFVPKTEIVWVKTTKPKEGRKPKLHFGMGRYVRASHESCLVCTRGRGRLLIKTMSERSVFFAPVGRHSEKPDAFFQLVERLVPNGRYLELFARKRRPGWVTVGDEVPDV